MKTRKLIFRIIRIGIAVLITILILMLFLSIGKKAYEFGYRIFTETAVDEAPGKDVVVLVRSDMSKKEVAEMLEQKGLVNDATLFMIQYKLTDYDEIAPGTYTLNTSMTVHDMAAAMSPMEQDTETMDEEGELQDPGETS